MALILAQMFPGMEWIPLILVIVAVEAITGIAFTICGLLKRSSRIARYGGLSLIAFTLCFALIAFWLLRGVTTTGLIVMSSPLPFALMAVLLSFRSSEAPNQRLQLTGDARE